VKRHKCRAPKSGRCRLILALAIFQKKKFDVGVNHLKTGTFCGQ
jgi:hypothetical protein